MSSTIFTPFTEEQLIPKEEKLEVLKKGKKFSIGIPKETYEEKAVRREAMQSALKKAAEVPLGVAVTASKIMPLAATLVEKGNSNAVTDGLVSAMMTRTAVLGALLNVKINLGSIKDEQYVAEMRAKIDALERQVIAEEAAVLANSPLK